MRLGSVPRTPRSAASRRTSNPYSPASIPHHALIGSIALKAVAASGVPVLLVKQWSLQKAGASRFTLDELEDVVQYLNELHYRFGLPAKPDRNRQNTQERMPASMAATTQPLGRTRYVSAEKASQSDAVL
jgi:hypothetical protein